MFGFTRKNLSLVMLLLICVPLTTYSATATSSSGTHNGANSNSNSNSIGGSGDNNGHSSTNIGESDLNSKVGIILFQGQPVCTAFASGKAQVTTAANCVDVLDLHDYTFSLPNKKPMPILKARVNGKAHLIFLKVDKLEDYWETATLDEGVSSLSMVAFDINKKTLVKNSSGEVWNTPFPGVIFHTFASERGFAGAPIIQNGAVVGVHLGRMVFQKLCGGTENDKKNIVYNVAVKYKGLTGVNLNKVKLSFDTVKE